MRERTRQGASILGLGAAACVACCAGPILAFLGGLPFAGLASALVVGAVGLVVAVAAAVALAVVAMRRRRQTACAVPVAIPIYDDTTTVACTAGRDELPARIEVIERLRTHLDRAERTDHGLLLHFPNRPEVAEDLAQFSIDEKACCQFWGFAIDTTADTITFRWDGPPTVDHVLDELHDFFRTDKPLTALNGLL